MTSTKTSQEVSMLCLGSAIEPHLLEELKHIERPEIPDVQWIQPRNLFISHQDFFKMKPGYDVKKLAAIVRTEILHKYFPMILRPYSLTLMCNSSIPKSLDWTLAVSSIKDTRLPLHEMRMMINKEMETILKEACFSFQSIKFDPGIRLARIAPAAKANPQLKELEIIKMPLKDENIILGKLMLVKVTKDDFGLNYEYIDVPE